jgi:hypothetical protein
MGAMVEHSLAFFLDGPVSNAFRKDLPSGWSGGIDRQCCARISGRSACSAPGGFRRAVKLCMDLGYRDEDIHKMVSSNAARVLGLEALVPVRLVNQDAGPMMGPRAHGRCDEQTPDSRGIVTTPKLSASTF